MSILSIGDHRPPGPHPRGRGRGPGSPWDLKNYIFRGSSDQLRDLHRSDLLLSFLLCRRTEEACRKIKSLRKVDFSHPSGHYICMEKNRLA